MFLQALLISASALAAAPAMAAEPQQLPPPAAAQAQDSFDPAIAKEAVGVLATKLDQLFVFPEEGRAYASMLRTNLAEGRYATAKDPKAFADAVNSDSQAVFRDTHLKLFVVPPEDQSYCLQNPSRCGGPAEAEREDEGPSAIARSGWIADHIAYLDFRLLPGNKATLDELRTFISQHSSAKVLIVDLRKNRGGGLGEMDALFPQLFAKPTVLLDMDTRISAEGKDPEQRRASLRLISGPPGVQRREHVVVPAQQPQLAATKVYVLTSKHTASAAEGFALALQRTHRATLIGETTMGAGNYGSMEPLDHGFTYAAFIPFGRTLDPDTGKGWEGIGVKPNIQIASEHALEEALRLSGVNETEQVAIAGLR